MGTADLFGELYLRSTKPFLPTLLTVGEVAFLRERLPTGLVLDLGCGHGRHLQHLGPAAVGVDADPMSLREAKAFGPVARADFRSLPFRAGVFHGAYAWYNTLGTFEADEVSMVLVELGRCLGPGATLIVQGTNPARARAAPEASFEGRLPDGSFLRETSRWVEAMGRDEVHHSSSGTMSWQTGPRCWGPRASWWTGRVGESMAPL
jgi:SAM-dependent methyltransferase